MSKALGETGDPTHVPTELADALRASRRIGLVGHVTPDADALASMGALWLGLTELGKQPHMVLPPGSVSRNLQYLLDYAGLKPGTTAELDGVDVVVALDTAKEKRLNIGDFAAQLDGTPIANIDHHATNTGFGRWNWIVGTSSSTSELVYAVLRALGCTITPTIATLLYAGIHTDTQGFALSNTGPNSLSVGRELALAGAAIPEVCERMHRSQSRGEFDLLAIIYRNTKLTDDGLIAWSTADHDEIIGAGCTAEDIDDQVEVPRSLEGISAAILFTEGKRGKIRMNFRGESGVSVLALAQQFGGGGHHTSAGAILDGPMDEVTARVLPAAQDYVQQLAREKTT